MTIRRFYCEQIPPVGQEADLPPDEARHALRVLRLAQGDRVVLLNGAGVRAEAVVSRADERKHRERLVCSVVDRHVFRPPRTRLRLCVAVPRGKLMGRVIQDAMELGVWRVTPLICRYSVAKPESSGAIESWRRDAVEAAKQSGNVFVPQLEPPQSFTAALAAGTGTGYFGAVPVESVTPTPAGATPGTGEIELWIGPEGGFSDEESAALRQRGYTALTVGEWTLRVETAVPALVGYLLGRIPHDHLRCERC
ncbi:MAG: hypothetical protein A3K19_05565 [Lentisphaerae bacterium RIFOXYB12_FULL_65_16]|nr:MAG: hypothetical protein A3K18_23605 [Lentisphaerae bacterium RIFOXYA12_64_32]OGV94377.1 MAG: hypothetical protein A3K19_05565 [Lentisphaerae bacterium RIFOXYB12_FULL_65_16]